MHVNFEICKMKRCHPYTPLVQLVRVTLWKAIGFSSRYLLLFIINMIQDFEVNSKGFYPNYSFNCQKT